MRRLLAIAVPAVLLLGLPSLASAKGITSAKVCGADGCRTLAEADQSLLEGGPPTAGPSRREPFVRLTITVGVPGHVSPIRLLYLPRSELLLGGDGKTWMQPLALSELRVIAAQVTPFPASAMPAPVPLDAGGRGGSTASPAKASGPTGGSAPAPAASPAKASGPNPGAAPSPAAGASPAEASGPNPVSTPGPAAGANPVSSRDASSSGGGEAWWLALPTVALAAGLALALARRHRRGPRAKVAGAGS